MEDADRGAADPRALLQAAGLWPPEDEAALLAAIHPVLRERVAPIYQVELGWDDP